MHLIDGPGATPTNQFTAGNPFGGVPATTFTPEWMNAIQNEIAAAVTASGQALDKENQGQLLQAILTITEAQVNVLAGRTLNVIALVPVVAGDFFGGFDLWGIAAGAAAAGAPVVMIRTGQFTITKKAGEAFILGQALYWDTVAGEATILGTGVGKKLIGTCAGNALTAATTCAALLTGDASPVTT